MLTIGIVLLIIGVVLLVAASVGARHGVPPVLSSLGWVAVIIGAILLVIALLAGGVSIGAPGDQPDQVGMSQLA